MIVVHFFTRKLRRKTYLMADSSASENTSPLWPTADVVCEVDPDSDPESWVSRAEEHILRSRPDLEHVRTLAAVRRPGASQVFDMIFNVKTGDDPVANERKRSR